MKNRKNTPNNGLTTPGQRKLKIVSSNESKEWISGTVLYPATPDHPLDKTASAKKRDRIFPEVENKDTFFPEK